MPLAAVAGRTGISRGYLEQVASALRNARLLRSVAGRYGGYRLARPAEKITIGEIIEAAIGPICVVDCLDEHEDCPRSDSCECRVVYGMINDRIADVLREFTLANLADPNWIREPKVTPVSLADSPGARPGQSAD